jgi:fucose permease
VLLAGIVGAAIGLAGQGLAATFALLLIAAFAVNLGNGLLESSVGGLVADLHSERRTTALNLLHSFFGWGALLGPLVGAALILTADWRTVYLALAVGFLCLLAYVLALRRHFPQASVEEPVHWREIGPLLRSRTVQLGTVGIFLYVAGELSLSAWGVPYLQEVRGHSTLVASAGVSIFWATIAGGRTASAWLSAHLRPERLLQASAALGAIGTLILLIAPGLVLSLVGFALAGLGAAAIYPTIMAISTSRFPRLSGTVTGLITTATGLGMLIGPTLVGRLGDALGLERALYSVVAAMLAIVILYAVPAKT